MTQEYSIDTDKIRKLAGQKMRIALMDSNKMMTEEVTKQWLIVPFIEALGYNIYSTDVIPEYTLDAGIKNGEKVDYMIQVDGKPVMIIECKKYGTELSSKYVTQLYRYFSMSDVHVAILTNGDDYWFYTDSIKENIMDLEPYQHIKIMDTYFDAYGIIDRYSKTNMKKSDVREDLGLLPKTVRVSSISIDEQYSDTKESINKSSRNFFITDEYLKNIISRIDEKQEDNASAIAELTGLYRNFKSDVKALLNGLRTNNPPDWLLYELLERNRCENLKNKEILASHLKLEINQLLKQPLTPEEVTERTEINIGNRKNLSKSLNDYSMINDGVLSIYEEHETPNFSALTHSEPDIDYGDVIVDGHADIPDDYVEEAEDYIETLESGVETQEDSVENIDNKDKKHKKNKKTNKVNERASKIRLNHEYVFNDYSDGDWKFHKIGYAIMFGAKYDNISARSLLIRTFEILLDSNAINPEEIVKAEEFNGMYKIDEGEGKDKERTYYIEKYNMHISSSYSMDGIVKFLTRLLDYAKIPYEEIKLSFAS